MEEYNEENIKKLATFIVESWDMKTLVQYTTQQLIDEYENNEQSFIEEWEMHKGNII